MITKSKCIPNDSAPSYDAEDYVDYLIGGGFRIIDFSNPFMGMSVMNSPCLA